ncbi:hypothetical protein D3C76_1568040 [compost metagenome]
MKNSREVHYNMFKTKNASHRGDAEEAFTASYGSHYLLERRIPFQETKAKAIPAADKSIQYCGYAGPN